MPIILNHHLQEQIPHTDPEFPITYYHDELDSLPDRAGPLHWHTGFEIATAAKGVLDYQVGQQHIVLQQGDSIFVNVNVLHGIRQLSGDVPDSMPNIVFSGSLIAPETSVIYEKYIQSVALCDFLPFIVFRNGDDFTGEVRSLISDIYKLMKEQPPCYELAVQRNISRIFEFINLNSAQLLRAEVSRIQINSQVRLQKMLMFIYQHYAETITLEDIAKAADISRSEAGRCFKTYMECSPVEALIRYRLQTAHRMLDEKVHTLQQISDACGFNSVNYFSRQFRKKYGYSPSQYNVIGKSTSLS